MCMISPPDLSEYFTLWGESLATRTTPPSTEGAAERLQQAIELGLDRRPSTFIQADAPGDF